ncbi:hypothetical protein HZF08_20555 [Paenibacillus sp. CGMCC 1.16610]|uniref:Phosphotriesterase n=1 Tax=Paenibacillus anseongense TaxID=2682845 RepID=A0ABW9UDU3_9BACL|nr:MULTISPECIES: hypothetical protein [Paenibacillus]MBA2940679.1 hypothetical protein [Paenibacillus sp. CGMCC 1.16610]MVQ37531.1 hypothetical protein [Paenibacillus anseongense]
MLQTVKGLIHEKEAGTILVHEHVLVGFVEDGKLTPNDYDRDEVVASILPLLLQLKEAGWYTVGEEKGGNLRPYHHLLTNFLPYAAQQGLDLDWLTQCVTRNAYQAMRIRG